MEELQSCVSLKEARRQKLRAQNVFLRRLKKHKITRNLDLLNDFREAFDLAPLNSYPDTPYTETKLRETSKDYVRAFTAFKSKTRRLFTISKITRVDNTFHVLQYNIMKDKYRNCYGELFLTEKLMFHGTKKEVLNSICTYNFDRNKVVKHKFGHGISFAKDSYFATYFPHKNRQKYHKVMIVAQMFWNGLDLGTKDMIVPSRPGYTSANAKGTVIVKYDDASFYPLYIVYYDGLHYEYKNRRK